MVGNQTTSRRTRRNPIWWIISICNVTIAMFPCGATFLRGNHGNDLPNETSSTNTRIAASSTSVPSTSSSLPTSSALQTARSSPTKSVSSTSSSTGATVTTWTNNSPVSATSTNDDCVEKWTNGKTITSEDINELSSPCIAEAQTQSSRLSSSGIGGTQMEAAQTQSSSKAFHSNAAKDNGVSKDEAAKNDVAKATTKPNKDATNETMVSKGATENVASETANETDASKAKKAVASNTDPKQTHNCGARDSSCRKSVAMESDGQKNVATESGAKGSYREIDFNQKADDRNVPRDDESTVNNRRGDYKDSFKHAQNSVVSGATSDVTSGGETGGETDRTHGKAKTKAKTRNGENKSDESSSCGGNEKVSINASQSEEISALKKSHIRNLEKEMDAQQRETMEKEALEKDMEAKDDTSKGDKKSTDANGAEKSNDDNVDTKTSDSDITMVASQAKRVPFLSKIGHNANNRKDDKDDQKDDDVKADGDAEIKQMNTISEAVYQWGLDKKRDRGCPLMPTPDPYYTQFGFDHICRAELASITSDQFHVLCYDPDKTPLNDEIRWILASYVGEGQQENSGALSSAEGDTNDEGTKSFLQYMQQHQPEHMQHAKIERTMQRRKKTNRHHKTQTTHAYDNEGVLADHAIVDTEQNNGHDSDSELTQKKSNAVILKSGNNANQAIDPEIKRKLIFVYNFMLKRELHLQYMVKKAQNWRRDPKWYRLDEHFKRRFLNTNVKDIYFRRALLLDHRVFENCIRHARILRKSFVPNVLGTKIPIIEFSAYNIQKFMYVVFFVFVVFIPIPIFLFLVWRKWVEGVSITKLTPCLMKYIMLRNSVEQYSVVPVEDLESSSHLASSLLDRQQQSGIIEGSNDSDVLKNVGESNVFLNSQQINPVNQEIDIVSFINQTAAIPGETPTILGDMLGDRIDMIRGLDGIGLDAIGSGIAVGSTAGAVSSFLNESRMKIGHGMGGIKVEKPMPSTPDSVHPDISNTDSSGLSTSVPKEDYCTPVFMFGMQCGVEEIVDRVTNEKRKTFFQGRGKTFCGNSKQRWCPTRICESICNSVRSRYVWHFILYFVFVVGPMIVVLLRSCEYWRQNWEQTHTHWLNREYGDLIEASKFFHPDDLEGEYQSREKMVSLLGPESVHNIQNQLKKKLRITFTIGDEEEFVRTDSNSSSDSSDANI